MVESNEEFNCFDYTALLRSTMLATKFLTKCKSNHMMNICFKSHFFQNTKTRSI